MLSIVIKDSHEPKVIQLTYENIYREIKDIPGSEILVADNWFQPLRKIKNTYVCFLEPDCLVSSGYFSSQLGLFKKNNFYRRLAVLASATGVNQFGNRFFGFELSNPHTDRVIPIRTKKSTAIYPVQIAYIPGALIRVAMLKSLLEQVKFAQTADNDLVYFSTQLCLEFWEHEGRVHINPNTTYVTTEDYVNDVARFDADVPDLLKMFRQESI